MPRASTLPRRAGRGRGRGRPRNSAARPSPQSQSSRCTIGPMDFFLSSNSSYMSSSPRQTLPPSTPLQTQVPSLFETSALTIPGAQPPPALPAASSPIVHQSHPVDSSPHHSSGSSTYFIPILPLSPSDVRDESRTPRLPASPISFSHDRELPLDLATSENTILSPLSEHRAETSAYKRPPGDPNIPGPQNQLGTSFDIGLDDYVDQLDSLPTPGIEKQQDSYTSPSRIAYSVNDRLEDNGKYNLYSSPRSASPRESRPAGALPPPQVPNAPPDRRSECWSAAQVILRQIREGLLGCTDAQHRFQDMSHHTHSQGNHYPLETTYSGVEAFSSNIGLFTDHLRPNQGASRNSLAPAGSSLAELFTGMSSTSTEPRNICLHLEQPRPTLPHASSDIDSLLAFPSSLAAIRTEFYYCPTLQYKRRFYTDVHLEITIFYPSLAGPDSQVTLQLRRIPHLYLGQVSGIHDCSVYIFFPRLYAEEFVFESLTNEQMHRFTDYIMLDSISKHLPDVTLQHIPPGFQASKFNAAAQANEMRTGAQDSTSRANHAYLLQSRYLDAIWRSIQSRITQANLNEYSDAFLCIASKGHKLQFQGQDSFSLVIERFYERISGMFDYDFLSHNNLFLDFATEICPNYSSYTTGTASEAQVYLFKRCCLKKSLETLYEDEPREARGTTQFYNVKFLDQACNITHVPPKGSRIFIGGLRYFHCYGVEKEMSDAGTIYPFSNPSLLELSLDATIWSTAASAARWAGKRSRETLVESYCQSKRRVRCSYQDSRTKTFGVRTEYRITSTLLLTILELSREQRVRDSAVLELPRWHQTPSFVWAIETPRYVDFVLGNVQKMCATIEAITLISPKEGIRQAQSYLLYSLFQCLRFFFSRSALHIQPTLWYNRRVTNSETRCGLGFETTLPQSGYGWFLHSIIDWDRLQLREDIYPDFVINPKEILGFNWKTREARNASWQLDDLLEYLPTAEARPARQVEILRLLRHLCFRQFRQDVLQLLGKECFLDNGEMQSHIQTDTITFCYSDLSSQFGDLYLASGNRTKIKTTGDMFDLLWTSSKIGNRVHFENKPYRRMFEKASLALRLYPAMSREWELSFAHEFFTFHTIVPLPDGNGTLISTAKGSGKRSWWSITGSRNLAWGRSKYNEGRIPAYPASLSMSKTQLDVYLNTL